MHKRIAVAAAAALVSCGGSSWVDPTTGTFSAQDSADIMTMVSAAFSAVAKAPAQQAPLQGNKAATQPVSSTVSCAVSGSVTVSGAVNSSCNSAGTSCTFNGNMNLTLNTCTTQNRSVSPQWSWAPDGRARKTGWTPPPVSSCERAWETTCAPAR